MTEYIKALQKAIQDLHGLQASHLESIPITETFQGRTVWDGTVEVFSVEGHPKARKCFAWSHREGEGDKHTRYITVLELPPVKSPRDAVKAAIASGESNA
jgi:hypothetical protein